ncbi:MAG: hypothetical protein R6V76_12795 [Desulfobacterales bacterium]
MDIKDINNKNGTNGIEIEERRKILIVLEEGFLSESVMDYAILVAGRLDYDILALNVVPEGKEKSFSAGYAGPNEELNKSEVYSVRVFKIKAASNGIRFDYLIRFDDSAEAAGELIHEIKRIEFVLTGSDEIKEKIAAEVTIPVFSVLSNNHIKGGNIMGEEIRKKKPIGKTVGYGALTAVLYAAVFTNADTITNYFTKGSWYAALPIATVFIFSFAHGAFASNLWSLLGIEAVRKDVKVVTAEKTVHEDIRAKKSARKRPRARAYINPFHRI